MLINPDLVRLAQEHHRELLAQASQRQLRRRQRRLAAATAGHVARITRDLGRAAGHTAA
jgi:hypothetical protein